MTGACLFEPGPVAYFATTRDQARDIVWAELLEKVLGTSNYASHNEQRLEVTLRRPDGTLNRIRLFGWENIETARGKKYSLVVLDELDSMRAFEKQWREVIRATLTDYRGSGLFMGTPKGYKSLYRLETLSRSNSNYETFHFTSFDNPFLSPDELEEMRGEMTPSQYAQEMLAEYRDRMVYKRKLSDAARQREVRDLIGETKLDIQVADSEDPLAIDTLNQQLGLRLKPVVKGQGSVLEGINKCKSLLHQNRLTMDPSCEDLAWEKENYSWKLDKNDQPLDEPLKENDDASDRERYAVMTVHLKDKYVFRVRSA
jgi:hypothetical protein